MGTNQRNRRKFLRQGIVISLLAAIIIAAFIYADRINNPSSQVQIWFENPDGSQSSRYWVEIADSEGERSKGLMFKKDLPTDSGMLFIYRDEGRRSFWMKNTYIALDMIFLGADRSVVGIVESAQPMTTTLRGVDKLSKFIVELNAGRIKADKIQIGALLKVRGELPTALD